MTVNILGSEWTIEYRNVDADPILLDGNGGYTDSSINLIVISNRSRSDNTADFGEIQKRYLRHEIIHAFLYESGIGANFTHPQFGRDETYVDWIAIQFPKILKVFDEVGCL